MDFEGRLGSSDHDQRELDHTLVSLWYPFLLLWQDFP